jgi:hypothetical protein
MASLASASTSQIVTLPHLPELFDPNFLDVLLPPSPSSSSHVAAQVTKKAEPSPAPDASSSTPTNPLMTALKASSSATTTDNGDPAFKTTGSALLDAFQALAPQSETSKLADLLKDAWAEDPAFTLRMIWNTRSIHDGKGEKELFYKLVLPLLICDSCIDFHLQNIWLVIQAPPSHCGPQPITPREASQQAGQGR